MGDWTAAEKGGPGYACGLIGPGKAMLWYAPGGDRTDVHLILPGTACAMMGWDRMRDFLVAAVRLKAKPTRLDVALDDFDRRIGVFGVLELLDGDKAVSMAREWTMIVSGKIGSGSLKLAASSEDFMEGWQEVVKSATVYMGAPSSRQRMRVYDKYRESKGKINSIRWELQMRDDAAQQMLLDLVAAGDEWGRAVREHFVSFIDFRDQRTKNVTRGVRMEFYRQMMHEAKRVKMYPPKAARTMEELVEWKFKTQAPTLAVMERVYGRDMVDAMIEHGRTRLKPHHRALMASALATRRNAGVEKSAQRRQRSDPT